jgi:aspartyl-tRNA(Asn)/glutamyl-tRNA(Gln) amidotransferase subunit B
MRSSAEAVAYAKALHSLVRWIGICDGNMQEGSFRCDANVSVRKPGAPLGTRCEIKNLNSFRFLEKAIEFEVRRQVEVIEEGGTIVQETRLFDPDRGETRPMRSKEDAHDYRYFPDPDLLPIEITAAWIDTVKRSMPALPHELRHEFETSLKLPTAVAASLVESREKAEFFRQTLTATAAPAPLVANWTIGEVAAAINDRNADYANPPVAPSALARLLDLNVDGTVSGKAAKEVFLAMADGEGDAETVIAKRGLKQISDSGALESAVDNVIAAQPKLVDDYRSGKEKAFNALVGQVMKATQGKANPAQVNEILKRRLAAKLSG